MASIAPGETPPAIWSDSAILATDGEDLFMVDMCGTRQETLVEGDPDDNRSVVSFSIRRGGTPGRFDAVVLIAGADGSRLHHLRLEDAQASMTELPEQHQPDVESSEVPPRPTFSPDGQFVVWVEVDPDEAVAGPTLRTIGWTDEGPSTDGDDNASLVVTELPKQAYRAEDWTWDEQGWMVVPSPRPSPSGFEEFGHVVLRVADGLETVTLPIGRQDDGSLALTGEQPRVVDDDEGPVIDRADAVGVDGRPHWYGLVHLAEEGDSWVFELPDDPSRRGELWSVIVWESDVGGGFLIPLGQTDDPSSAWMDAANDLVLAGQGTTALVINPASMELAWRALGEQPYDYDAVWDAIVEGSTFLPEGVTFAALVPAG